MDAIVVFSITYINNKRFENANFIVSVIMTRVSLFFLYLYQQLCINTMS